jgi:hypothetical protein
MNSIYEGEARKRNDKQWDDYVNQRDKRKK